MRSWAVIVAAALATGNALSAEQAPNPKAPKESKTAPAAHAAEPAEVKIVSMPALPPPEVRVTVPRDDTARHLVGATWALFFANALLCAVTVWLGWRQSRDTKRRDRETTLREVNRAAHKVLAEATQVEQLAVQVPTARVEMYALARRSITTELKTESEVTKVERTAALQKIVQDTMPLVPLLPNTNSPLPRLSDKELTEHLSRLDARQVSIDTMRDAIAEELTRYQIESGTLRARNTAIEAAAVAGSATRSLKTKLGE